MIIISSLCGNQVSGFFYRTLLRNIKYYKWFFLISLKLLVTTSKSRTLNAINTFMIIHHKYFPCKFLKKKQVGQEDSMLCCVKLRWATILYIIHYTMWPCHCINNQIICRLSFKKNHIFNSWWRLYCSTLLILVAISDGGTKKLICINKC